MTRSLVRLWAAAALAGSVTIAMALEPGTFLTSGPKSAKRIALTFDDGPGPHTEKFLDLLDRYQVKATFFVLGEQVRNRPAVAKAIVDRGHEIASHTMSHVNYGQRHTAAQKELGGDPTPAVRRELMEDMKASREIIQKYTGVQPRLCRMPHGVDRPWIKEAARQSGFALINWTYGSDWNPTSTADQQTPYVKAIQPGAILLFHDGGGKREKSLALTEAVIAAAREQGYEIVPVGELLGAGTPPASNVAGR